LILLGNDFQRLLISFKEIAFNVLKKANEEIENCKWAQLRLGIIYLQKGDCNEAIRLFYNVIRNDPDD